MRQDDILDRIAELKRAGTAFAVATVVRTVRATAAKAGAKAVILPDGTVLAGWIGGGCARGAVIRAAREALADGAPRLISVQPEAALAEGGLSPGETRDGIRFARNMCPSRGMMDIFVEAVMPAPECVICGAAPVAVALADLAPRMGFSVTACAPAEEQAAFAAPDRRIEGYALEVAPTGARYVVVATQGKGDEAALRAALSVPSAYLAFVGSRAKTAALRDRLTAAGVAPEAFANLRAPAGLDLGAITPEEIALSILAEMVALRRAGQRGG
ncbi:XdhC/CoxI family protein [Rhodovulum tesquicola]|uniref:XdhC family protein n=1 Tax=Rhodovulum tesquicola TaxID=540254 RepID=UPI002097AA5C|nr:XdhC/CoxI family protein [Rhodovulum tesquicola]MCO8145070.1 XdhC/CoxI family protein [Rhodovulum tesquicola]